MERLWIVNVSYCMYQQHPNSKASHRTFLSNSSQPIMSFNGLFSQHKVELVVIVCDVGCTLLDTAHSLDCYLVNSLMFNNLKWIDLWNPLSVTEKLVFLRTCSKTNTKNDSQDQYNPLQHLYLEPFYLSPNLIN